MGSSVAAIAPPSTFAADAEVVVMSGGFSPLHQQDQQALVWLRDRLIYGLRLDCQVRDFWQFVWPDDELMMLYRMSRPFADKAMSRLWLVSALSAFRERIGLSCGDVGFGLGLTRGAVSAWECTTTNPLMVRAMAHARACQTAIDLRLYTREEWKFGT